MSRAGCFLMYQTALRRSFSLRQFHSQHHCLKCVPASSAAFSHCLSLADYYHSRRWQQRYIICSQHPCAGLLSAFPVAPQSVVRGLHSSRPTWEKDSSKVESAVKAMKVPESVPASVTPKRPLWKRIWDELVHYYHGFRLLFIDIKVSSRLVWKILQGQDLGRREHKQLVRTVSDLFRLLPFSVFIIVPFMELLLPVALKLFPNMLPSTFQSVSVKEDKIKKQFKVKLETAKFLQDTLDEMAVQRKGEKHSHTAKEFSIFFEKIRTSGQQADNEEILKFSKLFEDEITLDSLSRPQLIALCRLLELQPIGTNNFLQFQLRMKLRNLIADDQMIKKEGLDSLTIPELQSACRARGMRALGVPEDRLRSQLSQWLELSLNEQIPPSLLLLSRALYLPEHLPATDQLLATISSLPDTAATEAKYKIGEQEGKVDNKTKIELIQKEEEAIRKELKEQEIEEMQEKQTKEEILASAADVNLAAATPITKDKAIDLTEDVARKSQELSKEDIEELGDALDHIFKEKKSFLVEEEELDELKEEMRDYKEDVEELREVVQLTGDDKIHESKAASRLYNRVNKMIANMDTLRGELNQERETLQQAIDDKHKEGLNAQTERENIININELVLAIRRIQKSSDSTRFQRIADVLDKMDVDHDGAVEVDHVLKVIELLGRENVKVNPQQMNDIIEMLVKEETLEHEERMEKQREKLVKQPEFSAEPPSPTTAKQAAEGKE